MGILRRVKVYTRRGDGGETQLAGGGRVAKDDLRVDAYGAVDELNATIGVAALDCSADLASLLQEIQRSLFEIGSRLATTPASTSSVLESMGVDEADVERLEQAIDRADAELPPLTNFILPGGSRAAAAFHLARTVCRRAERRSVSLNREEPIGENTLSYLNRLSDLLFTLARLENARSGAGDVEWKRRGG